MQAYELIEILSDALNRLSKIGIKVTDFRHLAMYHEFKQLEAKGVLACFRAKMDVMGIPIHWERYL